MARLPVCLLALLLLMIPQAAAAKPKLIHYGWDNQRVENLTGLADKLKASPFDGVTVSATAGTQLFTAQPFGKEEFKRDVTLLKSMDTKFFANSYLVINAATDGVFDWTDDNHWKVTLNIMRSHVAVAKAGGFKGIDFDMEPYGKSPWDYKTQPAQGQLAFGDFEALVQRRAKEMMQVMQSEYPRLDVWCLYGLTAVTWLLVDPQSLTNREVALENEGYGLWLAFFGGWIKAAAKDTRVRPNFFAHSQEPQNHTCVAYAKKPAAG
jgi:chitinase